MNFKDTKTNKIITLEEIKKRYMNAKKENYLRYINFQEYLADQLSKYKTIELIWKKGK